MKKNIEKCFDVIQSQTYKAIEAIFVNDGSTDNSENIIIQDCCEISRSKN